MTHQHSSPLPQRTSRRLASSSRGCTSFFSCKMGLFLTITLLMTPVTFAFNDTNVFANNDGNTTTTPPVDEAPYKVCPLVPKLQRLLMVDKDTFQLIDLQGDAKLRHRTVLVQQCSCAPPGKYCLSRFDTCNVTTSSEINETDVKCFLKDSPTDEESAASKNAQRTWMTPFIAGFFGVFYALLVTSFCLSGRGVAARHYVTRLLCGGVCRKCSSVPPEERERWMNWSLDRFESSHRFDGWLTALLAQGIFREQQYFMRHGHALPGSYYSSTYSGVRYRARHQLNLNTKIYQPEDSGVVEQVHLVKILSEDEDDSTNAGLKRSDSVSSSNSSKSTTVMVSESSDEEQPSSINSSDVDSDVADSSDVNSAEADSSDIIIDCEEANAKVDEDEPDFLKNHIDEDSKSTLYEDQSDDDEVICAICMGTVDPGERVGDVPCGHLFHVDDCLKMWLKKKNECPICSAPDLAKKVEVSVAEAAAQRRDSTSTTSGSSGSDGARDVEQGQGTNTNGARRAR